MNLFEYNGSTSEAKEKGMSSFSDELMRQDRDTQTVSQIAEKVLRIFSSATQSSGNSVVHSIDSLADGLVRDVKRALHDYGDIVEVSKSDKRNPPDNRGHFSVETPTGKFHFCFVVDPDYGDTLFVRIVIHATTE